ncbi:MAG: cyanophycinase [Planctomycetaceae bacterium]|nr:cyanophycinase [Planctomycetaceae bacterium]
MYPKIQNLFTIVPLAIVAATANAQLPEKNAHLRPIVGSRMVVGDGDVATYTVKCFLHLCRESSPNVVVIDLDGTARITETRLKKNGAGSVAVVEAIPTDSESLSLQLLNTSGIWIEGKLNGLAQRRLLLALLKNVTQRNGVIAVGSSSVSVLKELDENDPARRLESPFVKSDFHFGKNPSPRSDASFQKVHWLIPDSSVAVFHSGRRVAGYGDADISAIVEEASGWPEQRGTFECPDVFNGGSYPFYGLDLFSWVRSANERSRPLFPPKTAPTPEVATGTLFLHGGSGIPKDIMREFVNIAGGKEAYIVCIPSAQRFKLPDLPDSYAAGLLHELGHSNYTTLHTDDPLIADESEEFARMLNAATGVWIDGGRTYRFMDCYEGTRVEELIAEVLKRGGVVGGSSAGCQVPSDFLVRGNPRTNKDIVHAGYTRGMGLLKGVIIDAHFLQRDRHGPFLELMKQYPQMLGIGIDERTALVVKGHTARVLGPNAVSFYDLEPGKNSFKPVILKAGETYDLKSRSRTQ